MVAYRLMPLAGKGRMARPGKDDFSMLCNPNEHDDWADCSPGELSRMVHTLDAARERARNKKMLQVGMFGMLFVAAGIIVAGSFLAQSRLEHGGITCAECQAHFVEYHRHLAELEVLRDANLTTSMANHLAECRLCRAQFNQAYPGVLEGAVSAFARPAMRNPLPMLAIANQPALY